jgi:hypothetical protein
MPLQEGIAEYALVSAFEDHRFNAIAREELPSLECGLVSSYLFFLIFFFWMVMINMHCIAFVVAIDCYCGFRKAVPVSLTEYCVLFGCTALVSFSLSDSSSTQLYRFGTKHERLWQGREHNHHP